MKSLYLVVLLALTSFTVALAGPTNSILFVTQYPVPPDFTTIGSVFGNQRSTTDSAARGGDLYIRYPDGTLRNLTRAAGFGVTGTQNANGIAVRQPSMHWSGKKAVFSMVVGIPTGTNQNFWQLYEITNFTSAAMTPIITKVPNQPANFNNISPIYGTDDRIIFTSDRPRNGQAQLYPQLDEYEEQPTVTGLWSLQPTNGNLFMINHTPSGAFTPIIDRFGRVIFVRWDHLQRDQQADTDFLEKTITYGTFNWSDESPTSVMTTNQTEVFPEPRQPRTDLLAGTGLAGNDFNQFFPWQINEDGTAEETVNHIGRHEIGGSYASAAYTNDPNIQDLYYFGDNYNTNTIDNFLQISEDPRTPGLFYGIDAPEFGTHSGGQIVSLTGATNINPAQMLIGYLTPRSTHEYAPSPTNIPPDHTGFYRNPVMTTDGYMIAAHTAYTQYETGSTPTPYDFRLKFLALSNGYYAPSSTLTPGIVNAGSQLWEFDPVEVVARTRPAPSQEIIAAPELAAFAAAGVDAAGFQNYLRTHQLALIVSRDVTTRDHADQLQPYNLRIAGTTHQTVDPKAPGKLYDIAWLQLYQADQLRSWNYGHTNSYRPGRRVLGQYLHDPAVDNGSLPGAPLSSVKLGADGSMAAVVPARRAMSWLLADTNGTGVIRERYWITFAPGEIRTCTSCHGINQTDQAGHPAPTNMPTALVTLLNYWKTNVSVSASVCTNVGKQWFQISFTRRPAETGVTYHVQATTNLVTWTDIATYAGTNIVLTSQAMEVSRIGSPNEVVTVRDTTAIAPQYRRYLRVNVTTP